MSKTSSNSRDILKIYTDGAAHGNPGPAAYAFIFIDNDKIIHKGSGYIGTATNNTAEYKGIINALKAVEKFHRSRLQIYSDSNLVIKQINKEWRVNYPHLLELRNEVLQLRKKYKKVEFFYVSRKNTYIQKCDELCNFQLDKDG